ncbi:von Willebrand factor type A domain-containing protein [Fulvivirga sp. 29W222]|uniref:von Willebrand factor type A domain-containing protein n=1 Tax=Fulvivirga marina TaxID=2494733 RepID=A0A937FXY7_9BACT|nr:VWA domain-containing protein [Fulvivirga marina]MBL6446573.1 von Willebrand factor type A domain-containing protein [Fulvivirga marina]
MKRIGIFIMLLIISYVMYAQERVVTGTVTATEGGSPLSGVNVVLKGTTTGVITNINGYYSLKVSGTTPILVFSMIGYVTKEVKVGSKTEINVTMEPDVRKLEEVVITNKRKPGKEKKDMSYAVTRPADMSGAPVMYETESYPVHNTEEYDAIHENIFHGALKNPLSTFSIDVDAASYSNMRRFLNNGQLPPKDAVRIEEMINYFSYDYKQPESTDPFSVNTEISTAPWNNRHKLVHIGLQGRKIPTKNLPPSNLVFLLDVSGSMNAANKLPLLKSAFKLLVDELRPQDNVAIVVYAGAAGLVLPSTGGDNKETILNALNKLEAGGSTAGGAGIQLAYKVAKEQFKKGGNNRVILATDGDFNIGASSNAEMERLIEEKRNDGIFLTVLGFGMGNYKDSKMETIADKGNGNYAYIDNILEAKKVLVNEFGGTLFTIAKDVKIQVEFNPAKVKAYRLIGYENRALKNEDFNNDKKDAGELGAGHTVTALYEIIPVGVDSQFDPIDDLKYQESKISSEAMKSKELMTIKLRYKQPDGDQSKLITHALLDSHVNIEKTSDNFRWSAAVAGFGMLLRDSEFKGNLTYDDVIKMAQSAKGKDQEGYRIEFINLVKSGLLLARK